eukprot:TRINITY_DN3499_c0_g1_i3.p1 TRINITY_DN3499_c0_g1~~TRINITY_DN3499_c0_g1_i3.p1  ORF type:complete len:373 (-),score=63.66 TRINITY_DN3499_c0_g1_i3:420-1514(-)
MSRTSPLGYIYCYMLSHRFPEEIRGNFISQQGLKNLSDYKYSGEDKSIIYNYAVNPFAKFLCTLTPTFVAPNVLTLLGLLSSVAAFVLGAVYIPTFFEAAPAWVYYASAGLIFLYMMLDAMDGTQARRTGMASPMGELFDHLCDSLSMSLCGLLFGACIRVGPAFAFILLVACWVPFYLSHWDDYNTGKLVMGKFGGPTDLLVGLSGLMIFTGAIGPDFWLRTIHLGRWDLAYNHALMIPVVIGSFVSGIQYARHVFKGKPAEVSNTTAVLQLTSYALFLTLSITWAVAAPYLLHTYPHRWMVCLGLTNAYLLARVIVGRITKQEISKTHFLHFVLFADQAGDLQDPLPPLCAVRGSCRVLLLV